MPMSADPGNTGGRQGTPQPRFKQFTRMFPDFERLNFYKNIVKVNMETVYPNISLYGNQRER
jgi:hypothetical protein